MNKQLKNLFLIYINTSKHVLREHMFKKKDHCKEIDFGQVTLGCHQDPVG